MESNSLVTIMDNAVRANMAENYSVASTARTPVPIMDILKPSWATTSVGPAELSVNEQSTVDILPRYQQKPKQKFRLRPKGSIGSSWSIKTKKHEQKQVVEVTKPEPEPEARVEVEHNRYRRQRQSSSLATITVMAATSTTSGIAAVVPTEDDQSLHQEIDSLHHVDDERREEPPSITEDSTVRHEQRKTPRRGFRALTTIFKRSKSNKESRERTKGDLAAKKKETLSKKAIAPVAASAASPNSTRTPPRLSFPAMKQMAQSSTTPVVRSSRRTSSRRPINSNPARLATIIDFDDTTTKSEEVLVPSPMLHNGEIVAVDDEMATQPSMTSYSYMSLNKHTFVSSQQLETDTYDTDANVAMTVTDITDTSPTPFTLPKSRSKAKKTTKSARNKKVSTKSRLKTSARSRKPSLEIPTSVDFPSTTEEALTKSNENIEILTTKEKAAIMLEQSIARMPPILPTSEEVADEPAISQVIKKAALVTSIKKTKKSAAKRKKAQKEHRRTNTFPDDFDVGDEVNQLFTCCHEEMFHIMHVLPIYFRNATKDTPCEIPEEIPCNQAKAGCKGAMKATLLAGMAVAQQCGAGDINIPTTCLDDDISVLTDPNFTDNDDVHIVRVRSTADIEEKAENPETNDVCQAGANGENEKATLEKQETSNIAKKAGTNGENEKATLEKQENNNIAKKAENEPTADQSPNPTNVVIAVGKATTPNNAEKAATEKQDSALWDILAIAWSRSQVSKPELGLKEISAVKATEKPAPGPIQIGPLADIPDFHGYAKSKKMTKKEKMNAKRSIRKAAAAAVAAVAASKKAKMAAEKAKMAAMNSLNSFTSDVMSTSAQSTPEEAAAAAVAAMAASEKARKEAQAKIEELKNIKKHAKEAEDSVDQVTAISEESAGHDVIHVEAEDLSQNIKEPALSEEAKPVASQENDCDQVMEAVVAQEKEGKTAKLTESVENSAGKPKISTKKNDALLLPDPTPLIEEKKSTQEEIMQPRPPGRQRNRHMSRRRHEFEHRDSFLSAEREDNTIGRSETLKSARSGLLRSARSGTGASTNSHILPPRAAIESSLRSNRSATLSPQRSTRSGAEASSTRSPLRSSRSGPGPSGRSSGRKSETQTSTEYTYRSAMSRRDESQMAEMERLRAKRRHKKNSNTAPGNDEIEKARLNAAHSFDSSVGVAKGNNYPLLDKDSEEEDEVLMAVRPDAVDTEVDLSDMIRDALHRADRTLTMAHETE